MSSILEHPDDERFYIESVEPLIANVEQKGAYLHFLFRCPISKFEVATRIRPGDEKNEPPSPSLSGNPRLAGLLENALRSRRDDLGQGEYSVDEIEEAACDAFEAVSKDFFWDGSRWTHWEAEDRVLQFLNYGEQLEDLSSEQRNVLRRVLVGVAKSDGTVEASEKELLDSLLGSGALAEGSAGLPNPTELRKLRTRTVAAAVVCFGYAVACVDGALEPSEEAVLSAVCEAVGLGTLKQWDLKRTAQAFVVDEVLARTYASGSATNEERLEVYKFGRGLGLSIPDLRDLEWRFLRRTGLSTEQQG